MPSEQSTQDGPAQGPARVLWFRLERPIEKRRPPPAGGEELEDLIARSKLILKETAGASPTCLFRPATRSGS